MVDFTSVIVVAIVQIETLVFFVSINFWSVYSFDVLSQRRRISVPFAAARILASVRFFVRVRSILVFGSIGSVGECLLTIGELAHVRLLAGMRSQVSFQIFKSRVCFIAT